MGRLRVPDLPSLDTAKRYTDDVSHGQNSKDFQYGQIQSIENVHRVRGNGYVSRDDPAGHRLVA